MHYWYCQREGCLSEYAFLRTPHILVKLHVCAPRSLIFEVRLLRVAAAANHIAAFAAKSFPYALKNTSTGIAASRILTTDLI
jgi:hypothetical protein